jgi:hypothetical protein
MNQFDTLPENRLCRQKKFLVVNFMMQTMVNHFNFVARRAADYKLMVNSHESSTQQVTVEPILIMLPKLPEE